MPTTSTSRPLTRKHRAEASKTATMPKSTVCSSSPDKKAPPTRRTSPTTPARTPSSAVSGNSRNSPLTNVSGLGRMTLVSLSSSTSPGTPSTSSPACSTTASATTSRSATTSSTSTATSPTTRASNAAPRCASSAPCTISTTSTSSEELRSRPPLTLKNRRKYLHPNSSLGLRKNTRHSLKATSSLPLTPKAHTSGRSTRWLSI